MGYMFENGAPDNLDDALLSARIFAVSLSSMLADDVGVVANLVYQEKYPNDPYGKYIVYKEGTQIKIMKIPDDADVQTGDLVKMK